MGYKVVYECATPDGEFVACGTIDEMAGKLGVGYDSMLRKMKNELVAKRVCTKDSEFSGSYADVARLVFGEEGR